MYIARILYPVEVLGTYTGKDLEYKAYEPLFVSGRSAGTRKAHWYLVLRLPQTLRRMQQPGIVGVSEAVSGVTGAGHADDP